MITSNCRVHSAFGWFLFAFGIVGQIGGGRGGIRTHGGLPHARFRVECLKPDSATLPRGIAALIIECRAGNANYDGSMATGIVAPQEKRKLRGKGEAAGGQKNFTNKNLSNGTFLPHVVYPRASSRNNFLFATVHKLLPGLFTIFRMYSQSSTHFHFL
jgi:hypothetical protein